MKLERILPFARTLLEKAVEDGDYVVDATVGNGHDTVFLAKLVGDNGHVYGFDIQQQALDSTGVKLSAAQLHDRVSLFLTGHENVKSVIPVEQHGKLKAAIFNLGYLPGGDKQITTHFRTTITAVSELIDLLDAEGIIVLVIYHGHEEGVVEKNELLKYVEALEQQNVHVLRYQFINQKNNAPFIVAIEKR